MNLPYFFSSKPIYSVLVLSLLVTASQARADTQEEVVWTRVKNKDDIQVFRAHNENSRLKTFRVVARYELEDIRSFVAMILDAASYPEWGHMVTSAQITPTNNVYDYNVYITTRLPWPVKNRHVAYRYHIQQKPDYSIHIKLLDADSPPPERPGYILAPEAYGYFDLNVFPNSKEVEMVSEVFVDPGGYVPAFLVNLITDDLSFYSTKKIKKYIQSEKYQKVELDFIKRRPWVTGTNTASK